MVFFVIIIFKELTTLFDQAYSRIVDAVRANVDAIDDEDKSDLLNAAKRLSDLINFEFHVGKVWHTFQSKKLWRGKFSRISRKFISPKFPNFQFAEVYSKKFANFLPVRMFVKVSLGFI